MRVLLDTDIGGDTDDACALAFLLARPDVGLTAVTTVLDGGGRRAGAAASVLALAGREDVPVLRGSGASSEGRVYDDATADARQWPDGVTPLDGPPGGAIDALSAAVADETTIVATGPLTNLALLEVLRPGTLRRARVVAMAGWLGPAAPGLPDWGPGTDFNVQADPRAAELVVARAGDLTLVPLAPTLGTWLRAAHLPALRQHGALGALLARQAEAHGAEHDMPALAAANPGLPGDLLNFQYDPATCAVALGWPGAATEVMPLVTTWHQDQLLVRVDPGGRPTTVVTAIDGAALQALWLDTLGAWAGAGA